MVRSLRWRLQFWYACVLITVVAGYGLFLYFQVRDARRKEIDKELISAANYLDTSLRNFEPIPKDGMIRKKDGPPPKKDNPPPPVDRLASPNERTLRELTPPGWPESGGRKGELYYVIWRHDKSVIKAVDIPPDLEPPVSDRDFGIDALISNRREFREAIRMGPRRAIIVVGLSTVHLHDEMNRFAGVLAISGLALLLLGLLGGWVFSARMIRPVRKISETASRISAVNLSERIDTSRIDKELADLAVVLNDAFDRLETSFAQQARFTADASHELRTPLAIIKSHVELALSRPRSPEEYTSTLEATGKAADRMYSIVEGLLTLARADSGRLDLIREQVNFTGIVEECLLLLTPLAEKSDVRLRSELIFAQVMADTGALAQVVRNLLNNAIQYNRPGGEAFVRLSREVDSIVLAIRNNGPGIPEADQSHIFERFYRVDKARARTSGGNGLGLAICKSIVEAMGGQIQFTSSADETTFTVKLPELKTGIEGDV
ncbi:HAMP domain-containing protein [Telmatocola sphagniphila]|uniref:histidine kinase n=1 Tax=Telmatocola sphagniphila TaxID=1123043 RepID=A0A8E6BCA4_9BACT|nr:ATP-binding protein [Telmatocola sphagniphila]QVL34533.1 HAMP domain-containing protein [Telmatocola sphagniphila]